LKSQCLIASFDESEQKISSGFCVNSDQENIVIKSFRSKQALKIKERTKLEGKAKKCRYRFTVEIVEI
jgi:hypothetical protein